MREVEQRAEAEAGVHGKRMRGGQRERVEVIYG
jgi:hypothetical protein